MRSVSQYFSKHYRRCNINTENERRKDLWLNLASLRYFDTIVLHSIDWLTATLERRTGVPVYRRTTRRPERASPHIKHDDDKKRSYEWTLRTQPPLPLIQTCFQSSFCSWKISFVSDCKIGTIIVIVYIDPFPWNIGFWINKCLSSPLPPTFSLTSVFVEQLREHRWGKGG